MKNTAGIICMLGFSLFLSNGRKANAQTTTFNYVSDTIQTWTVPCNVNAATVNIWAAGGAGGNWNGISGYDFGGGSGSYYSGVLTGLIPGTVITLYVPSGGLYSNNTAGGLGGWPGGAQGGNDITYGEEGGGGGGYAAIAINGTYYVVCGAGGGGGSWPGYTCNGAGGGATTGGNGGGSCCGGEGYGATISAGGAIGGSANGCDPAQVGSYLAGGHGGGTSCSGYYGGGGGGAGYYGGGGGTDYGGGGGGGSSYPASTFTFAGVTFTPTSNLQGNQGGYSVTSAPGGPPAGIGQGGYQGNGGDGEITITPNSVFIPVTDTGNAITNVSCNGGSNGIASALVTGGAPSSFTYSWAPGGQTTDTVTGLSAGIYTVNVANPCGTTASATVTITQPNPMIATGNVVANVSCHGESNGSVSAIMSGGSMPFTYSWSNGGTMDTATGLTAGIYRVIVVDKNGCSASTTISITQPNALVANTNITSNSTCGISNGSITSTVGGGTMPYAYMWTGGGTNSSISGLSGGTYVLNVVDNNGCSVSSSATVTETPAVNILASTLSNVACNGDNSGSAISNVTGGTAPFMYTWSNGGTNFTTNGLTAGTYTVNVTDANGCSSSAETTITEPTPITVITDSTVDDKNCDGTAWVIVNGGVSPYNYSWSNGSTTYNTGGLCGGTICCTITDANGCVKDICVTVVSTTGIDNITSGSGQITLYPNPNNGQFNITSASGGQSVVEIYNVLGKEIYNTTLNTTKGGISTIDISSQPDGVYLYRILTENGNLLGEGKLIIQK